MIEIALRPRNPAFVLSADQGIRSLPLCCARTGCGDHRGFAFWRCRNPRPSPPWQRPTSSKTSQSLEMAGLIAEMPATSPSGLGRAETQALKSAVEWRSQASDLLASSREAHVTMSAARKSRKPHGSQASGTRLTSCRFRYYVSRDLQLEA